MTTRSMITLLLILTLSACSNGGPKNTPSNAVEGITPIPTIVPASPSPVPPTDTPLPTDTPIPTVTTGPVSYGPGEFPADVNPLTGQVVSNPELLNRRPISVKVQIFPRGQRPPWGISLADIVYDFYQNAGMTRFHTIFYSQDAEQVGPIRSARLFDGQVVSMYKSILSFGGADRRILNNLYGYGFDQRLILEGYAKCPPMCRIDPNGYNYLVTNTSELSAYYSGVGSDNHRANLDGMSFNSASPENGQTVDQFSIRFSISAYVRWDFDPILGRYLRFQDTVEAADRESEGFAPMLDRWNNEHIAADNVVILLLPHLYAYNTKPGLNEIIDIQFIGSGKAYAFRDGKMYEVQWNRPDAHAVPFLTFSDGTPFPFKPGNTWFEVIGQSSTVNQVSDGAWRFELKFP